MSQVFGAFYDFGYLTGDIGFILSHTRSYLLHNVKTSQSNSQEEPKSRIIRRTPGSFGTSRSATNMNILKYTTLRFSSMSPVVGSECGWEIQALGMWDPCGPAQQMFKSETGRSAAESQVFCRCNKLLAGLNMRVFCGSDFWRCSILSMWQASMIYLIPRPCWTMNYSPPRTKDGVYLGWQDESRGLLTDPTRTEENERYSR